MQELLRITTQDFELKIWSPHLAARRATYANTLNKRGASAQAGLQLSAPPQSLLLLEEHPIENPASSLQLPEPLFFENAEYQFEWSFSADVSLAQITHRRQRVNDSFRFSAAEGHQPARLVGTLRTGNDVGWLRLPLQYSIQGKDYQHSLALEVLPTKMLLQHDLPAMYRVIDQDFPLWRFSLAEQTSHSAASSRQRGNFPLLWLAQFSRLREQLESGLKVISQAPHSRLQTQLQHSRADRIKGRVPHRLGERIREDIKSQRFDRRYAIEKKQLSVDTPENRFIKMVVSKSRQQLARFEHRLRNNNQLSDQQQLSESFLTELSNWQQPMQKMLERSFLQDVGDYAGHTRESLVLQQKTGYSTVYRAWQELKFYLDVLAGQSEVSMKSVAEIYEVWCFLRIRQMLTEDLGFQAVPTPKASLLLNDFFEYQLKDGFAGAFKFKRDDGLTAELAHEPLYKPQGSPISTFLITQRPDIVLRVNLPANPASGEQEKQFIWLFDAKYRIKTERSRYDFEQLDINATDYVPDDAINQMHRYRDALIHLSQDSLDGRVKSRPVFGAFALYPGYFPAGTNNPYGDAIKEVGIGAFPLLPDAEDASGGSWLLEFLREQIGVAHYSPAQLADHLYVQDAARISTYGLQQSRYPDLCLTAPLGGQKGRDPAYFQRFEQGTAQWYHMPIDTLNSKYSQPVLSEIRYLAVARSAGASGRQIEFVWPVLNIRQVPRSQISHEQAGSEAPNDTRLYYLFELGPAIPLPQPIGSVPLQGTKAAMKLVPLVKLRGATLYKELSSHYPQALAQPNAGQQKTSTVATSSAEHSQPAQNSLF